ncbi:hypothetical protein [Neobacillus mesonae]|uniref:hypothetical protein n=1 Tax=Neobacillus mesonae TaxID=1193713 RepID=UPI00203F4FF0|nr:hypothetical protein [Neobacillus mesonae]MCM3569935.1 hypothetical protein [Neobacillus mesonae]
MSTVITYLFTLFVMTISVFTTLLVKLELEQLFHEKKAVLPFHICNVVIVLMVSFAANAVMTTYIFEKELKLMIQLVILLCMILPTYILGNLAFEKYKSVYRKYDIAEDGKVLVLNEKYLKKKKLPPQLKNYNSLSKENKSKI